MMKNNNTEAASNQAFVSAITSAEFCDPLYMQLVSHFADEMRKAIKGRICTPERMALLYPIFREINQETDETEAYWRQIRLKAVKHSLKEL